MENPFFEKTSLLNRIIIYADIGLTIEDLKATANGELVFVNNSTKKRDCIEEARRLMRENNEKGEVFYIGCIEGFPIIHAYYVPDTTKTEAFALNQADNGFEGYPHLTVEQVIKYGKPIGLYGSTAPEIPIAILNSLTQNTEF